MFRLRLAIAWVLLLFIIPADVLAGMPSALPEDFSRVFRLSESNAARLQAISFFLVALALVALAVMGLWNYLRRDFVRLPQLTFGKAIAVVVAWGLLFVVVLTMISGARELMTPGAWKKHGATYQLQSGTPPQPPGATDSSPYTPSPTTKDQGANLP